MHRCPLPTSTSTRRTDYMSHANPSPAQFLMHHLASQSLSSQGNVKSSQFLLPAVILDPQFLSNTSWPDTLTCSNCTWSSTSDVLPILNFLVLDINIFGLLYLNLWSILFTISTQIAKETITWNAAKTQKVHDSSRLWQDVSVSSLAVKQKI